MKTYVASLKFSRVWSTELQARNQEEAEAIAQEIADSEDNLLDINERECVVLVGVEEGNK